MEYRSRSLHSRKEFLGSLLSICSREDVTIVHRRALIDNSNLMIHTTWGLGRPRYSAITDNRCLAVQNPSLVGENLLLLGFPKKNAASLRVQNM